MHAGEISSSSGDWGYLHRVYMDKFYNLSSIPCYSLTVWKSISDKYEVMNCMKLPSKPSLILQSSILFCFANCMFLKKLHLFGAYPHAEKKWQWTLVLWIQEVAKTGSKIEQKE